MATTTVKLKAVIDAEDRASKKIDGFNFSFKKMTASIVTGQAIYDGFKKTVTATINVLKDSVSAYNQMQSSMIGLTTVSNAFGESQDKAKQAALDLANDGLLTVAEASEGLKNLIPQLGLERSIDLMNGFKDSAAFNRQGTLAFGQAIVGATQGIKNMNSILVDNAGITKNLSLIMRDAGFEMQDLGDETKKTAATDVLYNGLLKEMAIFQGDAEKAAGTLSGQQAKLATQIFNVKAAIGEALAPVVTRMVENIQNWIDEMGGPEGLRDQFQKVIPLIEGMVVVVEYAIKGVFAFIDGFNKLADAIGTVIFKTDQAIQKIKEFVNVVKGNTSYTGFLGFGERAGQLFSKMIGFSKGGIVPGPIGAPVPAIVHGGETVIPANQSPMTININNPVVREEQDIDRITQSIIDVLSRRRELAGFGAIGTTR